MNGEASGGSPIDHDEFDRRRRRVLWAMPAGLFVVGSVGAPAGEGTPEGRRVNLMTASWVVQVATAPKSVAVSVEVGSFTRELLDESGVFAISLLALAERALVRRFVKPVADVARDGEGTPATMGSQPVRVTPSGAPVLAVALGWLDCSVVHRLDLSSHVLYVGDVAAAGEREGVTLAPGATADVLSMRDTKMNYGG